MSFAACYRVDASGPRENAANGRYFEARQTEAQMPSPQFEDLNIQRSVIEEKGFSVEELPKTGQRLWDHVGLQVGSTQLDRNSIISAGAWDSLVETRRCD